MIQQIKKSVEFVSDIFDAKVKAMKQTKTESERPHLRFDDFEGGGNDVTWADTQAKLKAFLRLWLKKKKSHKDRNTAPDGKFKKQMEM